MVLTSLFLDLCREGATMEETEVLERILSLGNEAQSTLESVLDNAAASGLPHEYLETRMVDAFLRISKPADAVAYLGDVFSRQISFPDSRVFAKLWQGLTWGNQFDFSSFIYFDYADYQRVVQSAPYSQLHDAFLAVGKGIAPSVVEHIKQLGLRNIYSMGPSPSVDAQLLEQLVDNSISATYHPIDNNARVVTQTLELITEHLDKRFGRDRWSGLISLGDAKPSNFGDVKSSEPSCVIYSGTTMMNGRQYWRQASRIAKEGGIVVAGSAVELGEKEGNAPYWLSIYDTPEGKAMFYHAVERAFPDLFTLENKGKWEIALEYVPRINRSAHWAAHQTPKISAQLRVKERMTLSVDGTPFDLNPTMSWAEVDEWEDSRSKFREWFDNDPNIKETIQRSYNTRDYSLLPDVCKRQYPIELASSWKPNFADFLFVTPLTFGMRLSNAQYVSAPISHVLNGNQGVVVAGVFRVEKPDAGWNAYNELIPSKPWPRNYPHDPAYLAWANSRQSESRT